MIRTATLVERWEAAFGGPGDASARAVPAPRPLAIVGGVADVTRRRATTGGVSTRRPIGVDDPAARARGNHRLDGPSTPDRMLHRADARRLAAAC